MFCTDVRNEVPVCDIVEGEERGRRADDKELLYGKEAEAVWIVFGQVPQKEAQRLDWTRAGEVFSECQNDCRRGNLTE